ncbi:MAG: AsmA family protein, partial [Bacteroidia bacterium]
MNFNCLEPAVNTTGEKPKRPFRIILRSLMWLFLLCLIALITCVCLVFIYEKEVKSAIVNELNKNLKAEVKIDPANIDLTIIKTFPKCALEFKDVLILEALNKKKRDTLIYAGNIAMLFNIKDLINKHYNIQKIKVSKAICHLSISKSGEPNYLFWKSDPAATGSDSLNFTLESIELNDIALQYRNHKDKLKTAVHFDHSEFSGDFKQSSYEMTSSGKGYLAYLEQNKTPLLNNKTIRYQFDIRINAGNYEIATAELAVNEMFFGLSGNFVLKDSLQSAALSFEGKKLDIAAVLSLLPEKHAARINDYSSEGEFFTTGKIKYKAGSPADVKAEFGIKNATVTYKPKNTKLERLNLNGSLGINQSESYLNLQNVSAGLGSNSFNGFCLITNLQDPYLNLSAGIDTKLEELNAFWPIDTLEYISGALQLKVAIKGKLKEIQQSAFSPNIEASGHATLKDIKTKLKGSAGEINVSGGSFTLENR